MGRFSRIGKGFSLWRRRKTLPILLIPITRGTLSNFYNFILGYFVPVYWESLAHPARRFAVVSCQPFDAWWNLLPGPAPKIIQASSAMQQCFLAGSKRFTNKYRIVSLDGWDKWERFPSRPLSEISQHLRASIGSGIQTSNQDRHILVLARGHTPSYLSEHQKTRYGSSKRNIPNLNEIARSMPSPPTTEVIEPELLSPQEMISRCLRASVIVGQHGAALSNILFAEPETIVIEFTWDGLEESPYSSIYEILSEELSLNYSRVVAQADPFAHADAAQVAETVSDYLDKKERLPRTH
jgi:hypothetical protein